MLNNSRKYNSGTNEITMNMENAVYVTNAVAINNSYAIANKQLIDNACVGKYSGYKGRFYFVTKESVYPAVIESGDSISNLILLRMAKIYDSFQNYAILQLDRAEYPKNKRLIMPKTLNGPANFKFKKVRVVSNNNGNNFFISTRAIDKRDKMLGMPVFNENFVLQGIVKESNANYDNKTNQDKVLDDSNIQKTFLVNDVNAIKNLLNRYNIEYSVISGNYNLDNDTYNVKDSVINIICIDTL